MIQGAVGRWFESKRAIGRFGFTFVGLAILFNTVILLPVWSKQMAVFIHGIAQLASFILNVFGEKSQVTDGIIYSPQYAITVLPACTAIEFSCIYCAAVLAFPASWSRKLIGIAVGIVAMTALNLVRIMSLYFTGIHFTSYFTVMHEQIWGIIQIPAIVGFCIVWVKWATHESLDLHLS